MLLWSNNPHFKWGPLWTQSESLNCSGLSQSRQDRKVRFGVWLNLFELSQEELICSSSVEKSWVFGVWGDLFPQIITDSTTAGGNPRFLQNLPLQRNTNNTSESGQWYDWRPEASKWSKTARAKLFLKLVPNLWQGSPPLATCFLISSSESSWLDFPLVCAILLPVAVPWKPMMGSNKFSRNMFYLFLRCVCL